MFRGKYRLSVRHSKAGDDGQTAAFCGVQIFPLMALAPDFTLRGQKLKSLPPLGHVHQLFQ